MKRIPVVLLNHIRGAIGKLFVVKHYKGGKVVITKFPDMRGIVASAKQRERRNLFKEAVVYAQWVIADEERKKAFRKTLPRKKRAKVYQAAIKLYMRMAGNKQWLSKQLAVKAVAKVKVDSTLMRGGQDIGALAHGVGSDLLMHGKEIPHFPHFPQNCISEGMNYNRGYFYFLHIISTY